MDEPRCRCDHLESNHASPKWGSAVCMVAMCSCINFNAAPAGGRGEEEKQVAQMAQSARRGET
jgi:hypothetical protein